MRNGKSVIAAAIFHIAINMSAKFLNMMQNTKSILDVGTTRTAKCCKIKGNTMKTGSCLCGGVTYELTEPLRDSVACHCGQCRKISGHYWSATQVPDDRLHITKDATLQWYQSSPKARRGFCNTCGASLFWQMQGEGSTSIGSGTIDGDTGVKTTRHIFVGDKGDYYPVEE